MKGTPQNTLAEMLETEAPDTVTFDGKVSGTIGVRYALGSNLRPAIVFGGQSFSSGRGLMFAGTVEVDVAGYSLTLGADGWRTVGYGHIRRPNTMDSNLPAKTLALIRDAFLAKAEDLARRFPDAFVTLGAGESHYRQSQNAAAAAHQLAVDAKMFLAYAKIAEGVEKGTYRVVALGPDEPVVQIRWNKPRSRDFTFNGLSAYSLMPIVGHIMHGKTLVGYAVNTAGHDPDCYHGPLMVPLDLAVPADQKTTSW